MERKFIEQSVTNYIAEVEHSIQEHVIERELGVFPIKRTQAFFLLLPFFQGNEWTNSMHQAAIAVSAVHAAFDAHDLVDQNEVSSIDQQLLVLAGDHFSGIHYQLLADLPDFHFIRLLSDAIATINEEKTNLLMDQAIPLAEKIKAVRVIETTCIVRFYEHFGFSQYRELASEVLLYQSLQDQWLTWLAINGEDKNQQLKEVEERIVRHMAQLDILPAVQEHIDEVLHSRLRKLI